MRQRADAHIHSIRLGDKPILGHKDIVSLDTYRQYFKSSNIGTAFVVFNDEDSFNELKQSCPGTDIYGFYWIHDLNNYSIPDTADALKFESYIDKIDISEIEPILDSDTKERPAYIHCGELERGLSDPSKVEALAIRYPDRKFIIGHTGAYAPPIGEALKDLNIPELVQQAIDICITNDNIWLETSILNYGPKLQLIAENIDSIKDKVLLGTDFPLTIGDVLEDKVQVEQNILSEQPTILSQEKLLADYLSIHKDRNFANKIIDQIYQNTAAFFR